MAKNDRFADIAAGYSADKDRGLVQIVPSELPNIKTTLEKGDNNAFVPFKKIETKEELYAELSKLRKYYKPFFRKLCTEG